MDVQTLCAAVQEAPAYLNRFTRKEYPLAFREYAERFAPAWTAAVRETAGEEAVLTGAVAVSALGDYAREVAAYTQGRGRLLCSLRGYAPCADQDAVLASVDYDPTADLDNSPDSVFCSHGAGVIVPWDEVPARAHVSSGLDLGPEKEEPAGRSDTRRASVYAGTIEQDKELQAIFERTYGKVERGAFRPQPKPARTSLDGEKYSIRTQKQGPEYLLVDGYNIIFSWEELRELSEKDIGAARGKLADILSNYQGYRKCTLILVYDAYKVEGNPGEVMKYHNIYIVYTKEAETADQYIEKTVRRIAKDAAVTVATSDGLEQVIILGQGANRMSAPGLKEEIERTLAEVRGEHLGKKGSVGNYLFDYLDEETAEEMEKVRLGKAGKNGRDKK